MNTISTIWMWVGFIVFVLVVLSVDILLLARKKIQRVSTREALSWTLIWITFALIFNGLLWWYLNKYVSYAIANQKALEFFTGYVIEESLSADNMFVFIMLFSFFAVPQEYQRRVLLYGQLGAIVMRLAMILLGTWLIREIHWILSVFGVFLCFTGIKMLIFDPSEKPLETNFILRWMKQHFRVTEKFHGNNFFIRQNYLLYMTPLFLVLVLIELSDLVFALDSIPAVFAVTEDPFIVFTSNIFAILGLRSLYFLLVNMVDRFYLLKYGIAMLLTFVGIKLIIDPWIKISTLVTLSVVVAILVTTIVLSLFIRPGGLRRKRRV